MSANEFCNLQQCRNIGCSDLNRDKDLCRKVNPPRKPSEVRRGTECDYQTARWSVKDCRAKKCDFLGTEEHINGGRCCLFGKDRSIMPGTLTRCLQDLTMPPEEFLDHIPLPVIQGEEGSYHPRKTPGIKNCPDLCPYKLIEEVVGSGKRPIKKGTCAFCGEVLGGGCSICHTTILDSGDLMKAQIGLIGAAFERRKHRPSSETCGGYCCPDGVYRCKKDDTGCPLVKVPFTEMSECPLWRIPAKMPHAPAIEAPAKPTPEPGQNTENKPAPESPGERLARGKAIREEVRENREAMARVMSGKSSVKKAKKEKPEPPALNVLYLEDNESLTKRMEPESVDLIFTDPPYPTEPIDEDGVTQWERAYVALHLIACKVLKPSGFLITYAPQAHLLDIMEILAYGSSWNINVQETGGRLDYFWIIPSINGGATCKAHKWNALCLHKPILVFQKAPFKSPSKCFADVVRGKKQKSHHAWQQSVHDAIGIISRFMEPGQVLYDPYACTATSLIAANLLGMQWIGAEIDPKAHAIGVRELQQRPMDLFTFGGKVPEAPAPREVREERDTSRQVSIADPAKEARPVECKIEDLTKEEPPAASKEPLCYCTPCKTWATCTAKPESKECQEHRKLQEEPEEEKGGCTNCGHHKTKKTFKESCTRLNDLLWKGGEYSAARLMAEVAADGCLGWIPKEEAPAKEEKCVIHYYSGKDLSPSLGTCPVKCPYLNAGKSSCNFMDQQFLRMESCPTGVIQGDEAGRKQQMENMARALARLSAHLPSEEECQCNPCPDGVIRCGIGDKNCPVVKEPFSQLAFCPMTNPRRVRQIRRENPVKFVSIEEKIPSVPVDTAPAQQKPNCGGKRPSLNRCPVDCPDRSIQKEEGYPQGRCKVTGEKLREMQACPYDPPKPAKKTKTEKPLECHDPFRKFLNEHHEQITTGKDLPIVPHVVEQYKRFDHQERRVKLFISDGKFPFGPWWTLSPSGKLRSVKKPTGDLHQGESYPDCRFRFEWHYDDKKKED